MPTLSSLYESKLKKISEDMEDQVNMDVLQALNNEDPLSTQKEEQRKLSVQVPNGEVVAFNDLPPEVQTMFKKVKIHATDKDRQPTEFKPTGYAYSLIYKQDKPIDFSGGWNMNTHSIDGEEYFMSLNDVDEHGLNLFYKLNNGKDNKQQVV
jgi:hypothetical protein